MVVWIYIAVLAVVLCFSFVLLFGAPYLPVLRRQLTTSLELLDLRPGDTMLELGCGDGRVLAAAAKQGVKAVGYELNPVLAFWAWLSTRRYGRQVKVHWGNYWKADWPVAQGVYAFILPKYMSKLDNKVVQQQRIWQGSSAVTLPLRVVSFAFQIPDRAPDMERDGIFLYVFPSPEQ
jgi:SAM-dependent methyltransferase